MCRNAKVQKVRISKNKSRKEEPCREIMKMNFTELEGEDFKLNDVLNRHQEKRPQKNSQVGTSGGLLRMLSEQEPR